MLRTTSSHRLVVSAHFYMAKKSGFFCATVMTGNEVLPHGTSLVLFCNLYYKTCFSQEAHRGTAAALLTHCVFLESLLCKHHMVEDFSNPKRNLVTHPGSILMKQMALLSCAGPQKEYTSDPLFGSRP